jgi:trk system potassium uptake protein TrkA
MRTVVIGAGEVGYHIAERLSREGQDVVVIEQNAQVCARVQEALDVMTVQGHGASPRVLEEAGIRDADMVIAVADIDEVNIAACLLAKEYGVPKRIARARNPEFSEHALLEHGKRLGIDLLINPNAVVAEEVLDLVKTSAAAEVGKFAGGKVLILGVQLGREAPILDRPLKTLRAFHSTTPFVVVAILREGRLLLPDGNTVLQGGDHIYLVAQRDSLNAILTLLGKKEDVAERVFVVGGGRIGARVAQLLEEAHLKVKLLERSPARCEELSRLLSRTIVLCGDGTDASMLLEEGISDMDAVVAVTDDEATNILAALVAKERGAKKVMALVKRPHLIQLLPHVGIDAGISPRILTANVILRFVRRGHVLSIFEIPQSDAETLEMMVVPEAPVAGKRVRDAGLPAGAIVAAIIHGGEIVIPRGDSTFHPDDRVVVFALPQAIPQVEHLFG